MVCVKCGRTLRQLRCDGCGHGHEAGVRLLGMPEEAELTLPRRTISVEELEEAIAQREQELQRLRSLLEARNGTATGVFKPPRRPVRDDPAYRKLLKEFFESECLKKGGKTPISRAKLIRFVYGNRLTQQWGLTSEDVEADLLEFYQAHGIFRELRDSVEMTVELRRHYLANGRKMLSDDQIKKFLADYKLTERFGILPFRVKVELNRIRAKDI